MMKIAITLILAGCFLAACATKPEIPVPTTEMVARSGESAETLKLGHQIYITKCARCHEPMMPSEICGEDWHIVVPGMAWNAGITEAEEEAVLKYILAAR